MTRTIRASVSGGMLVPLAPIDLPDGSEVEVTVETGPNEAGSEF
jgi:predicted DNA-binding antitoxin AbrB/MazE fold protein